MAAGSCYHLLAVADQYVYREVGLRSDCDHHVPLLFFAAGKNGRMTAKSSTPVTRPKPPAIFWRSFITPSSRPTRLVANGPVGDQGSAIAAVAGERQMMEIQSFEPIHPARLQDENSRTVYLTDPAVTPWMNQRWRKANAITIGAEATNDAAMAPPQSEFTSLR